MTVFIEARPDASVRVARALQFLGYPFNEAVRIVQSRQAIPDAKALELIDLLGKEADALMELRGC